MNKIIIAEDKIEKNIDKNIKVKYKSSENIYDVIKLEIDILKDTDLVINYENISKIDVKINVKKDVIFNLYEYIKSDELKIQNKFYLEEYSNVLVNKFTNSNKLKELDIVYLNGEGCNINHNFNTISKDMQKIDMVIYHNHKNTISNVVNKAVNIDKGSITFNVTGVVYNNITDCVVNQNNRIINLNDNKCTINPILLIDENDVEANHSALIGKFKDEEIFYLMSRGITKEKALNLLIKGFLYIDIKDDEKINKIIDKHWR